MFSIAIQYTSLWKISVVDKSEAIVKDWIAFYLKPPLPKEEAIEVNWH